MKGAFSIECIGMVYKLVCIKFLIPYLGSGGGEWISIEFCVCCSRRQSGRDARYMYCLKENLKKNSVERVGIESFGDH
jgi:hypothetical protein